MLYMLYVLSLRAVDQQHKCVLDANSFCLLCALHYIVLHTVRSQFFFNRFRNQVIVGNSTYIQK